MVSLFPPITAPISVSQKFSPLMVHVYHRKVEKMLLLSAFPLVPPAVDGYKQHLRGWGGENIKQASTKSLADSESIFETHTAINVILSCRLRLKRPAADQNWQPL